MNTLLSAPALRSAADETAQIIAINARNNLFWASYNRDSQVLSENPLLCELAFGELNFWMQSGIGPMTIPSFDEFLRKSDGLVRGLKPQLYKQFTNENAVKAGSVAKADKLTRFITSAVEKDSELSFEELVLQLTKSAVNGEFEVDPRNATSRLVRWEESKKSKSAPVSGLKHRLSRAKKKLKSRASRLAR